MPSSRLDFIPVTNSGDTATLVASYTTPGTSPVSEMVRDDTQIEYSIQPVVENPPGFQTLYSPDYLSTDTFQIAIGEPDQPPEGGTFAISVGATTSGLSALSYDITAAALQTALNAALTTEGEPLCTVTLLAAGSYQIDAVSDGAIAANFFDIVSTALLVPESDGSFSEQSLGSVSSRYQVLLVLVQAPICYSEPTTQLPAAGVSVATIQAGSATTNKIQQVSFDVEQTYTGTYAVNAVAGGTTASCGVCNPNMTAEQFGQALAVHSGIEYQNPDQSIADNILPSLINGSYFVEFIGTLANSSAPGITVTNIDLVGPQGQSGTINLNTIALYKLSLLQDGDTFTQQISIVRTRVSGEVKTLLLANVTLSKDIINRSSMVPTPRASYYTLTEVDALLATKQDLDATLTAISGAGTSGTGAVLRAVGYSGRQAGTVLTADGAITIASGIVYLEKTSAGAFTIAAPSGVDQTRITIIGNTDFAHVVTFTGATLLDGTTGANSTATFTAFKGSSLTVVARGAFWLLESNNLVALA